MTTKPAKAAAVKAAPPASAPQKPSVPRWMTIAKGYIGVHEGDGVRNDPTVMRFFVEAGHAEVHNDHTTPWCAAFVGAILHEAGLPTTGSLWALDYAKYGTKLSAPVVGAIGTKTRHGGGHVFFIAGFDASYVYALGGNQNDQVCIERIPRSAVHSYAWPPGVPVTQSAALASSGAAGTREA